MKLKVSKENQKGLNTEFVNVETGKHISLEHAVTQINKGMVEVQRIVLSQLVQKVQTKCINGHGIILRL